jgi:hypothetical protein
VNRAGDPRRGAAGRVLAGATGMGVLGASAWAISSGQIGLAIGLAIVGAVGSAVKAVVPQNSRDRVEWTRTICGFLLHRGRDRAALQLAHKWLDAGRVQLPPDAPGGGSTTRPPRPRRPRPSRS